MPVTPPARLSAALALGVAVALAATAVPAHAESVSVRDPRGDVVDGRFGGSYPRDNADILSTTLDHRARRVVMRLAMVDVEADVVPSIRGRLATPSGARFTVGLSSTATKRVDVTLTKDGEQEPRPCDGLRGSLLPARDQLVLSVPRSCLKNPRSVRFGALVVTSAPGSPVSSYDDARRDGGVAPFDYEIKIGSREVRRG